MTQLIDPIPQIREWGKRILHIHGKDATVRRDVIARYGIYSPVPFVFHRTPGFGDSNWTDIISILRQNNYTGAIDIEGWHDPVYRGELELTGQVHGLNYLKFCRGGDLIPPFTFPEKA
jgi:sugar phosphate isomerase/epimerase